jgi:metal-responsive CopG/Arc/MetJ family transcriptional regulator
MTDKPKIRLVVDEDAEIVAKIDELAALEGLSRSDMLRRAIRRLFLTKVPARGNIPQAQPITETAETI